jgi:hypothetical protein
MRVPRFELMGRAERRSSLQLIAGRIPVAAAPTSRQIIGTMGA